MLPGPFRLFSGASQGAGLPWFLTLRMLPLLGLHAPSRLWAPDCFSLLSVKSLRIHVGECLVSTLICKPVLFRVDVSEWGTEEDLNSVSWTGAGLVIYRGTTKADERAGGRSDRRLHGMSLCPPKERLCLTVYEKKVKVLVTQSNLTLCDPMGYSLPGSSVLGIPQARILERVVIPFSRGSSWPRDRTWVSCIAGRFFTV